MRAFHFPLVPHLLCGWLLGAVLVAQFGCADEPAAKPSAKSAPKATEKRADKSADKASDKSKEKPAAKPATPPKEEPAETPTNDAAAPKSEPKDADGLVKISKEFDVFIDVKRKQVVVDGEVCLREGQLEMFACPKGTKEHESVVAVKSDAQTVHTALLAIGALAGSPVKFDPKYEPATGTVVEIQVQWTDKDGKPQTVRAQEWVRNVKTEKAMAYSWVFAGSKFWTDEDTGTKHYQGNAGDLVCVSNFPTATLDLPVESTQANTDLMFEAFTDRIPPRGTKVKLVFMPKLEKKAEPAQPAEKKSE